MAVETLQQALGDRWKTGVRVTRPARDEARESSEMSKAVGCHIRSTSTDTSALSVTPVTVSRALASVLECSCCSLLSRPYRAQKDPCMTLIYPFPVHETHRRLAGTAGDESWGGPLDPP